MWAVWCRDWCQGKLTSFNTFYFVAGGETRSHGSGGALQWHHVSCDGPCDHELRLLCPLKLVMGWGSSNYIGMIEVWASVVDFGTVDVWPRATNPDTDSIVPEAETHFPRKGEGVVLVLAWRRLSAIARPWNSAKCDGAGSVLR